ncbi:MAG: hypothetical protein AAB910_03225, partial [Patescibacteria group bacterium]
GRLSVRIAIGPMSVMPPSERCPLGRRMYRSVARYTRTKKSRPYTRLFVRLWNTKSIMVMLPMLLSQAH